MNIFWLITHFPSLIHLLFAVVNLITKIEDATVHKQAIKDLTSAFNNEDLGSFSDKWIKDGTT